MSDEVVNPESTAVLAERESWMTEIDGAIDETTTALIKQIKEDRDRAERIYSELLSLFNQGKTNPEDLDQLNKAQAMVQNTTDQLQKVFTTLAKIKTGDAKVQIAQINSKGEGGTYSTADLIDLLEGGNKDAPAQDTSIYETKKSV